MALWIEIQVSTSGIEEGSFSALATIPDTAGADSFDHTGVVPGQLYIYRARRYDDASGLRSDWSCLVFARPPITGGISMPSCLDDPVTGSRTELYIGVEPCEGLPTKAQYVVPYRSGGFEGNYARLTGKQLRNATTVNRKIVRGRVEITGKFEVEFTPEGAFARMLLAVFPVTTEVLSTPTRYKHTFKNLRGAATLTMIHRIGDDYYVYPGCSVDALSVGMAKDQEDVYVAQFTFKALDELIYPLDTVPTVATLLGTSGAAEDTLPPYSPVDSTASIGSFNRGVKSMNFQVSKNLGAKDFFSGKAGTDRHFERRNEIEVSANVFYEGDELSANTMGQTSLSSLYGAGSSITPVVTRLDCSPANNGGGFSNWLSFVVPNGDIRSTHPVEGPDEVMEAVQIVPVDVSGDSSGTDFYIELINSITNANLIAVGSPIETVAQNTTRKYMYGVVKTGGTTTVFASDSGHLDSTDDIYNGKTVKFLTGALAGTTRTISDYTGSTHTITVSSALGSAPVAGVAFEIY